VKAGTGRTFETDHERIAVADCAPYFHLIDSTVELQGHCQSFTRGWAAAARCGGSGCRHGLKKSCRTNGNSILPISPQCLIWIKLRALDGAAMLGSAREAEEWRRRVGPWQGVSAVKPHLGGCNECHQLLCVNGNSLCEQQQW
jgi:hypothetical protein